MLSIAIGIYCHTNMGISTPYLYDILTEKHHTSTDIHPIAFKLLTDNNACRHIHIVMSCVHTINVDIYTHTWKIYSPISRSCQNYKVNDIVRNYQ